MRKIKYWHVSNNLSAYNSSIRLNVERIYAYLLCLAWLADSLFSICLSYQTNFVMLVIYKAALYSTNVQYGCGRISLIVISLCTDLVSGFPLGTSLFINIIIYGFLRVNYKYLKVKIMLVQWAIAIIFVFISAALLLLLQWIMGYPIGTLYPLIKGALLTCAFYPYFRS